MITAADQKFSILIVEDEPGPRDALRMILRPFFTLHTADNALTAMRVLRDQPVDLITLDLKLPDRQGVDLLHDIKLERDDVEVIIITGYGSLKTAMDAIRHGAAAYLLKPFNVTELVSLINQTLEKKQRLDRLRGLVRSSALCWETEQDVAASWQTLNRDYAPGSSEPAAVPRRDKTSEVSPLLLDMLEAKSRVLFNRSCRVSGYAGLVGEQLGLKPAEQKALTAGALLHDIGWVAEEHAGWTRGSAGEESAVARRHPETGARMIAPLDLPAPVKHIIAYHHERHDGSGYPHGLRGDGIPQLAQIVALAQAFDELVTEHGSTHSLVAIDEACEQIRREAGRQFDPKLAERFIQIIQANRQTLPALMTSSRSSLLQKS